MNIITVKNLTKEYVTYERGSGMLATVASLFSRKKKIVKAVSDVIFRIDQCEIVGMIMRNVAAQDFIDTLVDRILIPTRGEIEVMSFNPYRQRTRYVSHIGAMFGQKSQLVWDIPPLDSFLMNKAIYGIDNASYKKTLDILVSLLEAGSIINRPTRVLSLGERMKCEFIIALLHNPTVVFLDEPTIGLDVIAKDSIRGFIKEMNANGVTFILTTHDLGDIESLANRTIIIDNGSLVFDGSIATLKSKMGNRKTVTVKTKYDVVAMSLPGVSLAAQNPGEQVYNIDVDVLPMNELLSHLSSKYEISDISIQEPQMEEVVRLIYGGVS